MASRPLDRAATAILEAISRRRWGFPALLMRALVNQLGPLRALAWLTWNLPSYERTLARFGPVRTHLLGMTISLVNGSEYCSYGQGLALQLTYLRDHHKLFPLDEHQLCALRGHAPTLIRHRLLTAVRQAGLHSDATWLDRTIELALSPDPRPTDYDDVRVLRLVDMLGPLNAMVIADELAPDEAHDPINKDHELKRRYRVLRTAQAGAEASPARLSGHGDLPSGDLPPGDLPSGSTG